MDIIARDMPTDPVANLQQCLEKLAEDYGDEWTFLFLGAIRDHRGPGVVEQYRTTLAQRLVAAEQSGPSDFDEARRAVADRLGYHGGRKRGTRTNFYKILAGQIRTGEPNS